MVARPKSSRYRLPRGPRRSPETYRIQRRDGQYLADASAVPYRWTPREMAARPFRSRETALDFIDRHFVGPATARGVLGLRVV